MQKTSIIIFVYSLIIATSLLNLKTYAQKKAVIRHPSKTVVITKVAKKKVVYVKRVPRTYKAIIIKSLPSDRLRIVHHKKVFFYHSGVFYKPHIHRYKAILPPPGLIISALPANYTQIKLSWGTFYYVKGIYYKKMKKGYEVTKAPEGAIIETLPDNINKVTIEGKVFYEHNGTLYKKVETLDGFAYIVSGKIEE